MSRAGGTLRSRTLDLPVNGSNSTGNKTIEASQGASVPIRCSADYIYAGVAQLVEQLICNQPVVGSSPTISSKSVADVNIGGDNDATKVVVPIS